MKEINKLYHQSNRFPYQVNINSINEYQVSVSVSLDIKEFAHITYNSPSYQLTFNNNQQFKDALNQYCSKKEIEDKYITFKSRKPLFSKEYKYYVYIYTRKYNDLFAIANKLFKGHIYEFDDTKKTSVFLAETPCIIKKFMDDKFNEFIVPSVINMLFWED